MARQMKKALCVLLSVLMACSCFALNAFAFTGYDRSGSRNDLRVQAVVSVDKTSYNAGETVTATITLNHPEDTVLGFQGSVAFDGSKLDFTGIAAGSGFAFYDASSTPSSSVAYNATDIHNGLEGSTYNASSFGRLLGASTFTDLQAVSFAVIDPAGVAAAEGTVVATLTFEAKAAVNATNIALIPSNAYHESFGFFSCVATTATDNVYESSYCATTASSAFEIVGGSTETFFDITFSWVGGSETKSTKQGSYPEAPTNIPDYEEGDYHYTFSNWSPELAPATAATTYIAQYSRRTIPANYDAYNQAVSNAIAKRDGGTWTQESIDALNAELAKDVSDKKLSEQSEVDAQTAAINAAAAALQAPAATYTVRFVDEDGTLLKEYSGLHAGDPVNYDGATPTKQGNAQYSYTFSGWSPTVVAVAGDATYTAQYTRTVNEYTVTFKNEDGTVLQSGKVAYGTLPTYTGSTPQKKATDQYSYAFDGWTPALVSVTEDAVYTATFKQTEKKYDVTFVNENGDELQFEQLAYGTMPTYKGEVPTKPANETYTYTFDGWDKDIAAVTGDVVYTAKYKADYIEYTITFNNVTADGEVEISSVKAHYGDNIVAPANPERASDDTYTYTFTRWNPEVPETVTGDATFTAVYTPNYINYTITFKWEGGSVERTVHWNEVPEEPVVPSFEKEGKMYSFKSWDSPVVACNGNAVYTAEYSDTVIVYIITFELDGNVISTQNVNAGDMPTPPALENGWDEADGNYYITYTGWDKPIVAATGDTTYTAQYTREFKKANYDNVEAAQEAAALVDRNFYTDDSLAVLDAALSAVESDLGRLMQEQVDAWATAINQAIADLKLKSADYTAYNNAVSALEAELAKADYTPDSVDSVRAQLTAIDNDLSKELKITDQSLVDDAAQAVAALSSQLVEKADKGELESLINEANALDLDKYIDTSALTAALATAQEVLADDNATPAAVSGAIRALRNAIQALEKKPADYTAWNALVEQYDALKAGESIRYYTDESKQAVENIIARVESDKNIDYQPTLDALASELDEALKALSIIDKWEGEKDWEDNDHEWFYSNLEFEKEVDPNDPTKLDVKVYLNHPNNTVSGIFVAMLFDADVVAFDSADINGGSLVYANAGDAQFNPADYSGYRAMSKAGVVKFAADFETVLAPTYASRDLIATLHFSAINSGYSYFKAVPLASNIYADSTVYSALIDEAGAQHFMHSEFISAEFSGIIQIKKLIVKNSRVNVSTVLKLNTTSVDDAPEKDGESVEFTDVAQGTYSIEIKAPGSLGYTIKNITLDENNDYVEIPEVELVFGDYNNNGVINIEDINQIITNASNHTDALTADTNGNGVVNIEDINIAISNYNKTSEQMVLDLQ